MLILRDIPNTASEDCWEHREVDGLRIKSFVRWPGDNGGKSSRYSSTSAPWATVSART